MVSKQIQSTFSYGGSAPLGNIIVPAAQRWLWVQTNTKQGYHFTSNLMYDSHSSTIAYTSDNRFRECYDFLKMHSFCKYQPTKHIELIDVLPYVPPEFHKLPFHLWDTDETIVDSFPDSDRVPCLHYQYISYWIQQPSYFEYTFSIL